MPNTKSAIRRERRVKIQTSVNKIRKSKFKSIIKQMNILISKNDKKGAIKLLPEMNSQAMKIAKTGVIKKKLRQEIFLDLQKKYILLNKQSKV